MMERATETKISVAPVMDWTGNTVPSADYESERSKSMLPEILSLDNNMYRQLQLRSFMQCTANSNKESWAL